MDEFESHAINEHVQNTNPNQTNRPGIVTACNAHQIMRQMRSVFPPPQEDFWRLTLLLIRHTPGYRGKMRSSRRIVAGVLSVVFGAGILLGHVIGRARAAGVPAPRALTYSGVLTDMSGAPLSGSKNIEVRIWDDETAGNMRCAAGPASQALVAGSFQMILPEACTAAVHATPDLWAEVFVDSVSLGRTKLGAVPYALEAALAADATGALKTTIVGLDSTTVKITGDQTIAGNKTFSGVVALGCPSGMVDSGAGYCIDANDRQETAYGATVAVCAAEGKTLCSFNELCTAKARNVGSLSGGYRVSDLMYWPVDGAHYYGGPGDNGLKLPGACSALTAPGPYGSPATYRCCRAKG